MISLPRLIIWQIYLKMYKGKSSLSQKQARADNPSLEAWLHVSNKVTTDIRKWEAEEREKAEEREAGKPDWKKWLEETARALR